MDECYGQCPLCGKLNVKLVVYQGVAVCVPCGVSHFTEKQERERQEYEEEVAQWHSLSARLWRLTNWGLLSKLLGDVPGMRRPRWGRRAKGS